MDHGCFDQEMQLHTEMLTRWEKLLMSGWFSSMSHLSF